MTFILVVSYFGAHNAARCDRDTPWALKRETALVVLRSSCEIRAVLG
jgi:hypothetical protein